MLPRTTKTVDSSQKINKYMIIIDLWIMYSILITPTHLLFNKNVYLFVHMVKYILNSAPMRGSIENNCVYEVVKITDAFFCDKCLIFLNLDKNSHGNKIIFDYSNVDEVNTFLILKHANYL